MSDIANFYMEKGAGERLILLHGNSENSEYFANQMEFFSKKFLVTAIDTRGHGKTPRGTKPLTIRQFADDLNDFMTTRNISKAHILGFSDGANTAICFALKYPEKTGKLILNGGNLNPCGVRLRTQLPIEISFRVNSVLKKISRKAAHKAELLRLMTKDPFIAAEELKQIRSPALVIAGTDDMIRQKHTELIARMIPDSRLVFINGGHFIAAKNPKDFNRAVMEFLEE